MKIAGHAPMNTINNEDGFANHATIVKPCVH